MRRLALVVEKYLSQQKSHLDELLNFGLPESAVSKLPHAKAAKVGDAFLAALQDHVQWLAGDGDQGDATDYLAKCFVETMYEFWVWWTGNLQTHPLLFDLMTSVAQDADLWPDRDGPDVDLHSWLQRKFQSTFRPSEKRGQNGET